MTKDERRRGRPPSVAAATATVRQVGIRLTTEDDQQLASIRVPGLDEVTVTRAALRLGMSVLELEPTALLNAGLQPAKRRAWVKAAIGGGDK